MRRPFGVCSNLWLKEIKMNFNPKKISNNKNEDKGKVQESIEHSLKGVTYSTKFIK